MYKTRIGKCGSNINVYSDLEFLPELSAEEPPGDCLITDEKQMIFDL